MENIFDSSNLSVPNGNYFALPYSVEESELVIISVPWDVTVSYGEGTAMGPDAIITASEQLDLHDGDGGDIYKRGIGTLPIEESIILESCALRKEAVKVIEHLRDGDSPDSDAIKKRLLKVNSGSEELNNYVYNTTKEWIDKGKLTAIVGGDHSTPFGSIKAVAEKYGKIGILHIDAHADLRQAYEGFKYSHASIMYNVLNEIENVERLVQVGIRDYCHDEKKLIDSDERIITFFDDDLCERKFEGESWGSICRSIVSNLPDNVYISFDIDGLSADLCPSTGTPVAGGLTFNEAKYLIREIVKLGKKIVGVDLTEVSPGSSGENEWDANVGARVLFKLCNLVLMTK